MKTRAIPIKEVLILEEPFAPFEPLKQGIWTPSAAEQHRIRTDPGVQSKVNLAHCIRMTALNLNKEHAFPMTCSPNDLDPSSDDRRAYKRVEYRNSKQKVFDPQHQVSLYTNLYQPVPTSANQF